MPGRDCQEVNERSTLLHDDSPRTIDASKADQSQESQKTVPWKQVTIILILNAAQPFANELIFPFINQMILEAGITDNPEHVGFYSGVIETLFSLMSFLFVLPCSFISDRYGRRPVVLLSIAIMSISVMLFGFSKHYWFMIIMRSIGGISGASSSTMKVMLGELTDKSTQGTVFAMSAVSYRVGQIFGQPVGGLLSHPERHINMFDAPVWRAYPYALPCVFSASVALAVVFVGCFMLDETRPVSSRKRKARATEDLPPTERKRLPSWFTIFTPHVTSVLSSLVTMVTTSVIFFAVYPLFAFTPVESGGLGLSEAAIGIHMALRSFISLFFMLAFGRIQNRTSALRVYQWATTVWPLSVIFFPLLSTLAKENARTSIINTVIIAFFIAWGFACLCWPASAILINDAAPNADSLASVVGVAQMAIILSSGLAPALGTAIFALSKSGNLLGGNLIWVLLFCIGSGTALLSWTIKETTHDWRKDNTEE